ncbi:MAG: hypothetical protein LBN05_03950 [Oscillospiraceae bacterium]|jgi:Flp pilus assembly protein TadB|nr:hypothetical protein [Oscillospiraceae bacterium]
MTGWVSDNIPLMAGSAVALLSFLSALFKFLNERNSKSNDLKDIKRMKEYAEIYSSLPDEASAKKDIDQLLALLTQKMLLQNNRKINKMNLAMALIFAIFGGSISYLLAWWATLVNGFWAIIIWGVFGIIVLFTLAMFAAGLSSLYKNDDASK